jgi:hypothetical protein
MPGTRMTNGPVKGAAAVKMFSAKASSSKAENNLTARHVQPPPGPLSPAARSRRDAGQGRKAVRS